MKAVHSKDNIEVYEPEVLPNEEHPERAALLDEMCKLATTTEQREFLAMFMGRLKDEQCHS